MAMNHLNGPQQGAYRTAAARASQYRLELDHLRHSRDNAVRREHELDRALDDQRQAATAREADLKRRLRNSQRKSRLNEETTMRMGSAAIPGGGYGGGAGMLGGAGAGAGGYHSTTHNMEAQKLTLERKLLNENRRVLELEEELDRQLTREQRMKRQVDGLRQEEEARYLSARGAGVGAAGLSTRGGSPAMTGMAGGFEDERMYGQAISIANMRSALSVQQAEIEDLQRVKRELREKVEIDREGQQLRRLEAQERQLLAMPPFGGATMAGYGAVPTAAAHPAVSVGTATAYYPHVAPAAGVGPWSGTPPTGNYHVGGQPYYPAATAPTTVGGYAPHPPAMIGGVHPTGYQSMNGGSMGTCVSQSQPL